MNSRYTLYSLALLGLLMAGSPLLERTAEARGKKRVVVLPFSGPKGAKARAGVIRGLKRKVTFIGLNKYNAAAEELGAATDDPDGVIDICSKLKCDALISGTVRKKRRKFTVAVKIINGGTGETIGRRAATARGTRRLSRIAAQVGKRSLKLIRRGTFPKVAPKPPPPPEPPPEPVTQDVSDIPKYKPDTPLEEEEEEEEKDDGAKSSWAGFLDLSVAMGMSNRNATLAVVGELPDGAPGTAFVDGGYEGGWFPEFTVRADIYPLVPFVDNFVRNIGIGVSFNHHISISTKTQDDTAPAVDTSSQELMFEAQLRVKLLSSHTSPVMKVFFGYGMRDFVLAPNMTLTSFNYRFLRAGLDGYIPLGTPLIGVSLGGDIRPLMGVGDEALTSFAERTGGMGFAVRGGLRGEHPLGIFYFVSMEYLTFSLEFQGYEVGSTGGPTDCPDSYAPTSGSDTFLRFWVGGGYGF